MLNISNGLNSRMDVTRDWRKKEAEGIFPESSTIEQALRWLGKEAASAHRTDYVVHLEPSLQKRALMSFHTGHIYPRTWGLMWDVHSRMPFLKLLVSSFLIFSCQASDPLVSPHLQSHVHANWTTRNAVLSSAPWAHFPFLLPVRHAQQWAVVRRKWYMQDWT